MSHKKSLPLKNCLSVAIALTMASLAHGDDTGQNTSGSRLLDQVVVTATKTENNVADAPCVNHRYLGRRLPVPTDHGH